LLDHYKPESCDDFAGRAKLNTFPLSLARDSFYNSSYRADVLMRHVRAVRMDRTVAVHRMSVAGVKKYNNKIHPCDGGELSVTPIYTTLAAGTAPSKLQDDVDM